MGDWITFLVEYLRQHSLWFLGILIILQNNGAPFSSSILVMAAGTLAYYGEFSLPVLWGSVWIYAVIGDSTSFWLWRKASTPLLARFPRLKSLVDPAFQKAELYQNRYGKMAILLTRFPFSALGTFVNIFAAMTNFKYPAFLVSCTLGQILWASFYLGLGYWFGDYWEQISLVISYTGHLGLLILALVVVLYLAIRFVKKRGAKGGEMLVIRPRKK